jgi:hypothetical protein
VQLTQTGTAIAFCPVGVLVLVVAHYEMRQRKLGQVPLISSRAKHTIGLLLVIIGALIFAAQLILRR